MLVVRLAEMVRQKAGERARGEGGKNPKGILAGEDRWGGRLPGARPVGPGLVAVPGGRVLWAGPGNAGNG